MLQLKKQTKTWTELSKMNTPIRQVSLLQAEEDLPIRRNELNRILQQFASNEEQLQRRICELEYKNRELKSTAAAQQFSQHEFERQKHLLSIKQQLIITQQKEIDELKSTLQRQQGRQSEGKDINCRSLAAYSSSTQQQDLNELSKIENIDQYDSAEKENRGFETRRKICLKKSIKNNLTFKTLKNNDNLAQEQHKLEIARLKAEINRLQSTIEGLQVQLQIAEIEKEYLNKDCEITTKQEKRLQKTLSKILREKTCNKNENESNLSQKCEILEKYIDKLTEKMERLEQPQLHHLLSRKYPEAPPITPHFSGTSGTAFVFPTIEKRTPTKQQQDPSDELFEVNQQEDIQKD